MELAAEIKRRAADYASSGFGENLDEPVEQWFRSDMNLLIPREVSYQEFARGTQIEYANWLDTGASVPIKETALSNLFKWVETVSMDRLSALLNKTPAGTSNFEFTPFQRLALVVLRYQPYSISTSINMSKEAIAAVNYRPRRVRPLVASRTLGSGCPRLFSLMDLPVGAGKTALSLAFAAMLVVDFKKLCRNYRARSAGTLMTTDTRPARMILVAAPPATLSHFKTVIDTSVAVWKVKWPALTFVVWPSAAKHTAAEALDMPDDTIVILAVEMKRANEFRLQSPHVPIACLIEDECIQGVAPRHQGSTTFSPVVHRILCQATPYMLVDTTKGASSDLRDFFGGPLTAPRDIDHLIRDGRWKAALLAMNQRCVLGCMSTQELRGAVLDDISQFVPLGFRSTTIRCPFATALQMFSNSDVDMVPANFVNTLIKMLNDALMQYVKGYGQVAPMNTTMALHDETLVAIKSFADVAVVDPADLLALLKTVKFGVRPREETLRRYVGELGKRRVVMITEHELIQADTTIARVIERTKEAVNDKECPICYEPYSTKGLVLMACCGFALCSHCVKLIGRRCSHCRATIKTSLPRADVNGAPPPKPFEEFAPVALPSVHDFYGNLANIIGPRSQTQRSALWKVLNLLRHHDYKRVILVIKKHDYQGSNDLSTALPWDKLAKSGYELMLCKVSSSGSSYATQKARFDDSATPPCALVCDGVDQNFLVGADLCNADALVCVGQWRTNVQTQALGRVLRPNPARPRRWVPVMNLVAG